jgi:hypothetical protein
MRQQMSAFWSDVVTFVSNAASFVVLGLAAVGAVVVFRQRARAALFVLLTALFLSTQPIILYGDPRYRVPAEPFFAILAAAGLYALATALVTAAHRRGDRAYALSHQTH